MHLPGAMMSTSEPKLLKSANVSSTSYVPHEKQRLPPSPPALPSVSARAETVMTSLYAAGTRAAALPESFAAAATTTTPALTTRQLAAWRMSLLLTPQSPPSRPHLATLMLTAAISGRFALLGSRWEAIQSRPQTYQDSNPAPVSSRILTAHRRTPGATPTTPLPLSIAPTVPATWVPWP